MKKDYVPDSFANFHAWADNLHEEIANLAGDLGWAPAEVTALQAQVAPLRAAAAEVLQKQSDLDAAIGLLRQRRNADLPDLRKTLNRLKTAPGYHAGIGQALSILTTPEHFESATYQPTLKAAVYPGHVRLVGTKRGADALNLYVRRAGQTAWSLLAAKRVSFPFDDEAPLATPGTPEVREYRAIGVEGDNEIGQPSHLVTVTYGG